MAASKDSDAQAESRFDELIEREGDASAVLSGNGLSGVRSFLNTKERAEIKKLKVFLREQDDQIVALRQKLSAFEHLDDTENRKPKRIKLGKSKPAKSAILCLSDFHMTELVSLDQTGGRNETNEEISRERIRSVVTQSVSEMKSEARKSDLQHLTIWLGGDFMVNADLHYKFERNTPDEPLVEMEKCYAMLFDELSILSAKSPVPSISVVGSVSNHDRDTEKMQLGMAADRSYDTAIYYRLAKDFPSLDWDIARTYWTVNTVGNFSTMFHHGHGMGLKRNNAGAMVPNWPKLMNLMKLDRFSLFIQGHYHTAGSLVARHYSHVANGSIVGENGYATDSGFPPEPPAQQLVFVNHDHNQVDRVVTLYA